MYKCIQDSKSAKLVELKWEDLTDAEDMLCITPITIPRHFIHDKDAKLHKFINNDNDYMATDFS